MAHENLSTIKAKIAAADVITLDGPSTTALAAKETALQAAQTSIAAKDAQIASLTAQVATLTAKVEELESAASSSSADA